MCGGRMVPVTVPGHTEPVADGGRKTRYQFAHSDQRSRLSDGSVNLETMHPRPAICRDDQRYRQLHLRVVFAFNFVDCFGKNPWVTSKQGFFPIFLQKNGSAHRSSGKKQGQYCSWPCFETPMITRDSLFKAHTLHHL